MSGQEVLASSAFLIGILMGFVLAVICMLIVGASENGE